MSTDPHRSDDGRRRAPMAVLLLAATMAFGGCQTVYSTVGAGATGGEYREMTQWYGFWGLWPIGGAPDARTLAGDRTNYRVYSGFDTGDSLLNLLTFPFGFYKRTIAVDF